MRWEQRFSRTADPYESLLQTCGTGLKYFWQPDREFVSLSGTTLTVLQDRIAGANMTVDSGTTTWGASAGPYGRPAVTLGSTTCNMRADGVSIAAANRTAFYVVGALAANTPAASQNLFLLRETNTNNGRTNHAIQLTPTNKLSGDMDFTTSGQLTATDSTTLVTGAFHLISLLPYSTGAHLRLDGVNVSSDFAVSETLRTIESVQFGQSFGTANSGGSFAMAALIDVSVSYIDTIDLAMRNYVAQHFGISV